MGIAQDYIDGLKQIYYDENMGEAWDAFAQVVHGASQEDIERLKAMYPDVPESLIELLRMVDGTYYREYAGENVLFYFFGTGDEDDSYPYYLLSAAQMTNQEERNARLQAMARIIQIGRETPVDEEYEIYIDEKIAEDTTKLNWLHFSDCMNNGGSSRIFIDFSPSAKGVKGQVVRFFHDPDEIRVIADSFDEYLEKIMDAGYPFIEEEEEW